MKLKQLFESIPTSKEEVGAILKKYGITNYVINEDLSVDVDGDVHLIDKKLKYLPVTFGKVRGNFNCPDNKLSSLQGAPREVSGNFNCSHNKITSLDEIGNVGGQIFSDLT